MQIGNIRFSTPAILAPMAGITCLPYRMLNRRMGCEGAFLEMINARSLHYCSRRTKEMMPTADCDRPLGVQLLGCEEYYLRSAIEKLADYQFDILDFNAACPRRKITSRGEGAALLGDHKKLNGLLKLMVQQSRWPVTVKIRIGYNDAHSARDIALSAGDAGIAALFVHGRTSRQGYSGTVDYDAIASIKKALDIPVIASGDIFSVGHAKNMIDRTGCDGVLVARGALGNPWLFKQLNAFFGAGEIINPPSLDEISNVMIEHLDAFIDFYGSRRGILKYRKFFIWYTRGFSRVKTIRIQAQKIDARPEMISLIETFKQCGSRRQQFAQNACFDY